LLTILSEFLLGESIRISTVSHRPEPEPEPEHSPYREHIITHNLLFSIIIEMNHPFEILLRSVKAAGFAEGLQKGH
jgi:hypothetical protein